MNDNMITLLCVMALESESGCDSCKGGPDKNVLLIVCPASETEQGNLEVTARMRDLACMGSIPAAIARFL